MSKRTNIARLLRQTQTPAEKRLWTMLRNRQFQDLKFRRQHPLKEYFVDFFCVAYGIVVEVDGAHHNSPLQKAKDEQRDLHLKNLGYCVLRFGNKTVFKNPNLIFKTIAEAQKRQQSYADSRNKQLGQRRVASVAPLTPTLSPGRGGQFILSTKILTATQKQRLLNTALELVEYDAISTNPLDFEIPGDLKNAIFTSQNAVKSFLKQRHAIPLASEKDLEGLNAFCVGEKTKSLLEENGIKVLEMAQNASELAKTIIKKHKNESFYFFCGNRRREELPRIFQENQVDLKELRVYNTQLHPKKQDGTFAGVLFFSPTGLESFMQRNTLTGIAFCIGETTAEAVKKYTKHYKIAERPTVEAVVAQVIKHFNTHD